MHLLYSIALALALLVTLPFWLLAMLRHGKYREGLSARLGNVPLSLRPTKPLERCIWVHAVSVGEVLAVSTLIDRLKNRFEATRIVVSTTTITGQSLARKKFGAENVFYFPLDFSWALRPYFRRLRPSLVVIAETEFWPSFLLLAQVHQARVAVVNARISDRSFPRYRFFRPFFRHVLRSVDLFSAQSEVDRDRLVEIGADPGRVHVTGNLKFDAEFSSQEGVATSLRSAIPPSAKIMVCGSTVDGEEEILLDAFQSLVKDHRDFVLVLAPRHPERFQFVVDLVAKRAIRFWRRSAWNSGPVNEGVFLLDTIGELAGLYRIADLAFVGGSLVPRGGHNILEAARFGVPTIVGPHTENFRDILSLFEQANAVRRVDQDSLLPELRRWLEDPAAAKVVGDRAQQVYAAHAGATDRTLSSLEVLMWMPETLRRDLQKQVSQ